MSTLRPPRRSTSLQIAAARGHIASFDPARTIYYTGHETIIPSGRPPGFARWREALFAFMHQRAARMTLSLAFLAPDIVSAAAEGILPRGFGVSRLIDLPMRWDAQRQAIGLNGAMSISNR